MTLIDLYIHHMNFDVVHYDVEWIHLNHAFMYETIYWFLAFIAVCSLFYLKTWLFLTCSADAAFVQEKAHI